MAKPGFTSLTLTNKAEVALREFHNLLIARGRDAIPRGVPLPVEGQILFSEAVEVLAAIGMKALMAGARPLRAARVRKR